MYLCETINIERSLIGKNVCPSNFNVYFMMYSKIYYFIHNYYLHLACNTHRRNKFNEMYATLKPNKLSYLVILDGHGPFFIMNLCIIPFVAKLVNDIPN